MYENPLASGSVADEDCHALPRRIRARALSASRRFGLLGLLLAIYGVVAALPAAAQGDPLTATGTVVGTLKAGQTLQVRLVARHLGGWQQIEDFQVDLVLRGITLESMLFDPTRVSVTIQGQAGPEAFGAPTVLRGNFFSINAGSIGITAKGRQATITFPLRILATPPTGARLFFSLHGFDGSVRPPRPLSPAVESDNGFSWGTLAVAAIAALFIGGFFGSTFASRRRPPPRPSVYATVQRRLDQERSKP
jgi:hypothetical protein